MDNINVLGKVPPQDIELEKDVLGAIMLESNAIYRVNDILKTEHFYIDKHSIIYDAIISLSMENIPIDFHTVKQKLKNKGEIDKVGGELYIVQLTSNVASSSHIEHHSRIIAQKYIQRELIRVCSNIQEKAYNDYEDISDILDNAEQELFNIGEGNIKQEVSHINPIINEVMHQIEEAAKKPDGLSGVPSGFIDLDRITAGWQKSDLLIVAARPAMGKTAFVLSMARNMAVEHRKGVVLFSLEMSKTQLVNRLIASEAEIQSDKLRNGKLSSIEWQQLETRIGGIENIPLFIDDTAALSVFELKAKLRRLVMKHDIKIAIIDYLQLMTAGKMYSREQEVSTISRSLKAMAKELNIPIIALSQLNRSVESRAGDKRPQLSDLRESGAIEQDADMVMFIHRPEYYGIDEDMSGNSMKGVAELIIAKHRNGSIGDVRLKFKKETTRFSDWQTSFNSKELGEDILNNKINEDIIENDIGLEKNTEFEVN